MSESILSKDSILFSEALIIHDSTLESSFIPEEFGEEVLMMRQWIQDFIENDIEPNYGALEKQKETHAIRLLEKMGELGFLSTIIDEEIVFNYLIDNDIYMEAIRSGSVKFEGINSLVKIHSRMPIELLLRTSSECKVLSEPSIVVGSRSLLPRPFT